jgi:hypothetical protein
MGDFFLMTPFLPATTILHFDRPSPFPAGLDHFHPPLPPLRPHQPHRRTGYLVTTVMKARNPLQQLRIP